METTSEKFYCDRADYDGGKRCEKQCAMCKCADDDGRSSMYRAAGDMNNNIKSLKNIINTIDKIQNDEDEL